MEENLTVFPKTLVLILVGILILALIFGFASSFLAKRFDQKTQEITKIIQQKQVTFEEFSAQEAASFYQHFAKIKQFVESHKLPTKALEAIKSILPYFVKVENLNINMETGEFSLSAEIPNLFNLAELLVSLKREPVLEKVELTDFSYSTPAKFSISGILKKQYLKISP